MLQKSLYPLLSRHTIHSLSYLYHCIVFQVLVYLKFKIFGEKKCAACNQVTAGKLVQKNPTNNSNQKNPTTTKTKPKQTKKQTMKETKQLVQPELECLF